MNHFETTTVIQVDNYSCSFLNQRPKQAMTEVWLYFWFIYLHQDLSPKAIRSDKLVMPEQRWSLDRRPTVKILGRRHPRFRFYFSCKWSIFFLYLWCQLFLILSAVWSIFNCFWSKIDHHNFFLSKVLCRGSTTVKSKLYSSAFIKMVACITSPSMELFICLSIFYFPLDIK